MDMSFLGAGSNQGPCIAYSFSLSKSILPLLFFMTVNFFSVLIQGMYVAQDDLKLISLLSQPFKCQNYRGVPLLLNIDRF